MPAYALFFSLALLIPSLFYYGFYVKAARAYALTDERVLARKGWLSTNTVSVDYHKITDVAVSEDLLERLFTTNTGTVSVNTAGGPGVELTLGIWGLAGGRTSGRIVLEHVDQPYEVQRILRSLAMRAEELGPAEKPEER